MTCPSRVWSNGRESAGHGPPRTEDRGRAVRDLDDLGAGKLDRMTLIERSGEREVGLKNELPGS